MAKKKKKMTAAQAAAARREETEDSARRAKARERSRLIKKSAQAAQKEANKNVGLRMVLPIIIIASLIMFALAFTIGPGLMIGGK